jgi:hypothetical protein
MSHFIVVRFTKFETGRELKRRFGIEGVEYFLEVPTGPVSADQLKGLKTTMFENTPRYKAGEPLRTHISRSIDSAVRFGLNLKKKGFKVHADICGSEPATQQ